MAARLGVPVLVALAAAGLTVLLSVTGMLTAVDEAFYDRLSTRLPPVEAMPETVVVAIDDPTFAELGLAWPWPRELHAQLIEALRAAGARQIGSDVVFADPGPPAGDAALAGALDQDVILARYTTHSETPQGIMQMSVAPIRPLAQAARVASVDVPVDPDGAIRRINRVPEAMAAVLAGRAAPPRARIRFDPSGVQVVSFYQALDPAGMLPPGLFRDKTVLVGVILVAAPGTAAEMFRVPATASGAGFMAGVLIHAHAYRTLAARAWILPVHGLVPPLMALALALVVAALAAGRSAVAVVGWAGALACLPLILSAGLLALGIWLPPAGAALAALLAGSGQTVYDYARARRARAEIIRSFGQYLAPELVRQLAENPEALRLGGERRVLTVLFCDLRGFTTLSERMKDRPDLLTTWLNEAMEVLARAVVDNGGMVDKFIGDCVMALWNAPADDPDHAPHALAAGRAMVAGIAELSARIGAEGHDVTLACGVGINTGECTVGNMGSSLRFDYTAIGDPVNLASRLEGLTKSFGTPILIGSATARALGNEELVALGRAPIKGRSEEEEVFTPREMHVRAAPVTART